MINGFHYWVSTVLMEACYIWVIVDRMKVIPFLTDKDYLSIKILYIVIY